MTSRLPESDEERTIALNKRAHERLTRAKKEGEDYSDVIIRLTEATLEGLQRRGEMEIMTSDDRRLKVSIEQDKCLGAMSCVAAAPSVFAFDTSERGRWRKSGEPLGMRDIEQGVIDSDSLIRAAESCPYQAIVVTDAETGIRIFPR